jgi:hypothetical protein
MDDAARSPVFRASSMRVVQTLEHVRDDADGMRDGQNRAPLGAAPHERIEIHALDVLHRDVEGAVLFVYATVRFADRLDSAVYATVRFADRLDSTVYATVRFADRLDSAVYATVRFADRLDSTEVEDVHDVAMAEARR